MKICISCNIPKEESEFYSYEFIKNKGRCKECLREKTKLYTLNNKDKKKLADKKYALENKEKISKTRKIYVENNKDKITANQANWYLKNIEKLLEKAKIYRLNHKVERNFNEKIRRDNDIIYNLRTGMSKFISLKLKYFGGDKGGDSIIKFLPYTIDELKQHLESLFEPWMSWQNRGKYKKDKWDDNDQSTWTWQLDHIIPQSKLPYTRMEDDNFKKCWSLENLRPLSAKINVLTGTALRKNRKKST